MYMSIEYKIPRVFPSSSTSMWVYFLFILLLSPNSVALLLDVPFEVATQASLHSDHHHWLISPRLFHLSLPSLQPPSLFSSLFAFFFKTRHYPSKCSLSHLFISSLPYFFLEDRGHIRRDLHFLRLSSHTYAKRSHLALPRRRIDDDSIEFDRKAPNTHRQTYKHPSHTSILWHSCLTHNTKH